MSAYHTILSAVQDDDQYRVRQSADLADRWAAIIVGRLSDPDSRFGYNTAGFIGALRTIVAEMHDWSRANGGAK